MFDEDQGQGSVFDRLSELVSDKFAFIAPVWIIDREDTLTIVDYRPTLTMFLAMLAFVIVLVSSVLLFFRYWDLGFNLLGLAAPFLVCVFFLFQGTLREIYFFDIASDSYFFTRQFIHRRDVIEGAMSQFTGAYVKTVTNDESESYFVVLKQEGMFLTGVSEQTLREVVPIFNSYDRETDIANAIDGFISKARRRVSKPEA
jgi:hypothetical protein